MSRVDAAPILMSLGFQPDIDFVCSQNVPGSVDIQWLSAQPKPTEAELNAIVWSQAIEAQAVLDRNPDRRDLLAEATQAVQDNQTFINLVTPTNAQVVAQVKALTRQMNRVIRRLVQIS